MKNIKIISLAMMLSVTCHIALDGQVLENLSIKPEVKERMESAIKIALAYPAPDWCTTDQLQKNRKIIIEKCVKTLYNNYLAPINRIHYEGIMPSPTTFNGLWSWDSWKHAAALAHVDVPLAKNSILGLYDFQDTVGMIPDCVFPDTLNFTGSTCVTALTKPPISGWAIWEIYLATKDVEFVRQMLPKLVKYHEWRYIYRDINQNGLCEVGANVNNIGQARCEMADNAIRYDGIKLLKKSETCYSMDIESVDLNAYLYQEKDIIIKMAKLLGDKKMAKKYEKEKKKLGKKIQTTFFDHKTGFFYDIRIADNSFVLSQESNGWTALFAGVATKKQAKMVKDAMMNEATFNTKVPLPTASSASPKFNPVNGYWRGPVWIDQFYFGYKGLLNYGYQAEARQLLMKLLENGQGITDPKQELREYYNPLTGAAGGARNFGWTASHLLMMMLNK
jgi:putative isomerase